MHGLSKSRAKQIIIEIVRQAGGQLDGKTRLYKAFYFAHLFYYLKSNNLLSDWPIVHMPNGPGIEDADLILAELRSAGVIRVGEERVGPYCETQFCLVADEPTRFNPDEIAAIREAVEFVKSKTASELSDAIHEHSRSWLEGKSGHPLNIYIDVIPEERLNQDLEHVRQIRADISDVFRD